MPVKNHSVTANPVVVNSHVCRYNRIVQAKNIHNWQVNPAEARCIQVDLAGKVIRRGDNRSINTVAGVDISTKRSGQAEASVVVLSYPQMELIEVRTCTSNPRFPYIPGLLSFREAPLILAACAQLRSTPDMILVDGQGVAHPRRFGIASHLGMLLDIPTIGCAKSRLCGSGEMPGAEAGLFCNLSDGGEIIGAIVRTKTDSKPLYVSIGHKTDLTTALDTVLGCCRGYRLPEPTRLAHLAAGGNLLRHPIFV